MTSLEKTIVLGRGSVRIILSKIYLQFVFRRGGQGRGRCEKGRFRSMYAVKEGGAEYCSFQGGRTWQAFGGGKNGHETFRQARNYNFRDKCVIFARNLKFSNLTQ